MLDLAYCRYVFRAIAGPQRQIRALRQQGFAVEPTVRLSPPPHRLSFGERCSAAHGALLMLDDGELSMGNDVVIGEYANVRPSGSFVRLGDEVLVAQFVSLIASNHQIGTDGRVQRFEIDLRPGRHGITIGAGCWIGAHAAILPGVTLGNGCVVAAGAVVARGMYPAGTKLAGIPARALPA